MEKKLSYQTLLLYYRWHERNEQKPEFQGQDLDEALFEHILYYVELEKDFLHQQMTKAVFNAALQLSGTTFDYELRNAWNTMTELLFRKEETV